MRTGLGKLLARRPTASGALTPSSTAHLPCQLSRRRYQQCAVTSSKVLADTTAEQPNPGPTPEPAPSSKRKRKSKPKVNTATQFVIRKQLSTPFENVSTEIRRFANVWKSDLAFQSDVASSQPHPARRVDSEGHRHDLNLWLQLLQYRMRTQGPDGAALIWHGMRARDVHLPTTGPQADTFWHTFLRLPDLTAGVVEYAMELKRKKNTIYKPLYETVVAQQLEESGPNTLAWHARLKEHYHIPSDALKALCAPAASSKASLDAFKKIYVEVRGRSEFIYDTMITTLWRRNKTKEAMDWHAFLVKFEDMPSAEMSRSSMMHEFRRFGGSLSLTRLLEIEKNLLEPSKEKGRPVLAPASEGFTKAHANPEVHFSREVMYSFIGQAHGIAPKHFSDEFCSRLFATRAFSISLVISCLNMFGVQTIGPLALREMASRAGGPHAVTAKINDLRGAGIALGTDFFSKAVRRLARDNRGDILHSLLTSDQHPEVLEDMALQRELLASYIERDDWLSVHRTLTLLTLFHDDLAPQESWNILLRHYSRSRQLEKVQQILEDMRMNGIQVTAHSVRRIYTCCLIRRRAHRRPDETDIYDKEMDYLNVVTNIFFRIMDSGQLLPSRHWHELIKRYGMTGRFEEVAKLCLRLVQWYSPSTDHDATSNHQSLRTAFGSYDPIVDGDDIDPRLAMQLHPSHHAHPLRRIFSPAAVQAIISWGFKYGSRQLRDHPERMRIHMRSGKAHGKRKRVHDLRWPTHVIPPSPLTTYLRGVDLIGSLVEKGVNVEVAVVRRAVTLRLWQLFSPGESALKTNIEAKALNPYSLEEILSSLLSHWRGPPLFPGLLLDKEEVLANPKRSGKKRAKEDPSSVWKSQDTHQDGIVPRYNLALDPPMPTACQIPSLSQLHSVTTTANIGPIPSIPHEQVKILNTKNLMHLRNPTILDGLVPGNPESPESTGLTDDEIVRRRTQLALTVFGEAPAVGGKRSLYGQKIDRILWKKSIDAWARRPIDSKDRIFEGFRWTWRNTAARVSHRHRRSRFHVDRPRAS
jgi:pentatricopeptide repeat protein